MRTLPLIRRAPSTAAAALLVMGVAGCGILDTQQPNIVESDNLNTAAGAATKRLGAISQFTLAKDGDFNPIAVPGSGNFNDFSDGQILLSGIMSDELVNPGFIPTRTEIDQRLTQTNNINLEDLYRSLHRARAATEDAAASLVQFGTDPTTDTGVPEMLALAGFTYVYFAEDFCSGVAVSHTVNGEIVYGTQLTTTQILDTAIARFNAAIAHPSIAPGDPIHSLASVGLGRALLNAGRFAEAAASVASVPPDFVYSTEHATTPVNLHNGVFEAFNNGEFGVFDQEGGVGLDFVSANDVRVQGDSGLGADNNTESWFPSKYSGFDASVPTADYLEAQLIIAENELQTSNFAGMTQRLNDLRAPIGLAPLAVPAGVTEATDVLFRERAFWLFVTGHRLGDLRRLVRQYHRPVNSVFPNGIYFKEALTYGNEVNLPIPRRETNNPNVKGCLDTNP